MNKVLINVKWKLYYYYLLILYKLGIIKLK